LSRWHSVSVISKAWKNGAWVSLQFTPYSWNLGLYAHSSVFSWQTFGAGVSGFLGPIHFSFGWVHRDG